MKNTHITTSAADAMQSAIDTEQLRERQRWQGVHADLVGAHSKLAIILAVTRENADTFARLAAVIDSALTWDELSPSVRQKLTHAANLISLRCEPVRSAIEATQEAR